MAKLAYYRVSTQDQSIEAQRQAMGGGFDREFKDEGVSGATPAAKREGFAKLLEFAREGDSVHVYAVDRLGRDALDVQATVRTLMHKGIAGEIHGLGRISHGVGELIVAVLAQVADMERKRIAERTAAGRDAARESLAKTGKTHKGKTSMGRPSKADAQSVAQWRADNKASITKTAEHWGISPMTVSRYCAAMK